jgi:hypothetical protein
MKPNYLRILTQVDGDGCPVNPIIDSIINMPTGFRTELIFMGGTVVITLSSDSRVIELSNQNAPVCSGSALRSNAKSIRSINHITMLLIIFLGKNFLL